jgi:hypothetical protein
LPYTVIAALQWRVEGHAIKIRLPFDSRLLRGTSSESDFFRKFFNIVGRRRWVDAKLRVQPR